VEDGGGSGRRPQNKDSQPGPSIREGGK
jgi:hypothetical protein